MTRSLTSLSLVLFLAAAPQVAFAQATVFRGVPTLKIEEAGLRRSPEQLSAEKAAGFISVVSRIGDKYYWASRENVELVPVRGPAFVTYIAVNGSGYVRVIARGMKEPASLMSPTEAEFDYAEHLLIGLRSITYYGTARVSE